LAGPVITPVFKEVKSGVARVLGMFAKRARGAMARHIVKNRVESPHQLKSFAGDGYAYRPEFSDDATWVFTREQPRPAADAR
ncbi:MAG: peroxide stress protein YaaA, partial [Rhodospirillales bacterium]